jgi:ADP-dependent NAD(P)H-hydrate dehydratase / NAD(P)H-hydrate epimerase
MKILLKDQIRETDKKTIDLEGISTTDLMDRAALALFERIIKDFKLNEKILVVTGPGNNGGDALAIARLLIEAGYHVQILLCYQDKKPSDDSNIQLKRLKIIKETKIISLKNKDGLYRVKGFNYIIDGLFGSGLNRPLDGYFAEIVQWINVQKATKISIDLPSGLFGEDNRQNISENIVRSDIVFGLQFPRLSFLLAENEQYISKWELVDIAIHPHAIEKIQTPYSFTEIGEISSIHKKRARFSNKGTYGKGLLIAGSPGMMGAAVLATKGALHSGIGLLSVRIPASETSIVQISTPEALVQKYNNASFWEETDTLSLSNYSAIAIGPGIGVGKVQALSLRNLLKQAPEKLVIDADALNLLSEHRDLIGLLPKNTILTPHPKEFDRLVEMKSDTDYERLEKAIRFACSNQVYMILKGAYTACITPDGLCAFNSTGNPGMATGGSGDVLTGIILSLLAQGYNPWEACKLGVYLHGLSGDLAIENQSEESLLAGYIAENLGKAFKQLYKR